VLAETRKREFYEKPRQPQLDGAAGHRARHA